jgi:hypothetical protein
VELYGKTNGPAYAAAFDMISDGQLLLEEGDLVLRSGQEPTSEFIRQLNRQDKTYSHAGLVIFEKGYPFIYHLVAADEKSNESFRKDSLLQFANPRKNGGFGIYRYQLSTTEKKKFTNQIKQWYRQGITFDADFDLQSDDKMYCSELIKKAVTIATSHRIQINTTTPTKEEKKFYADRMQIPLSSIHLLSFVSIDNLYNHVNCSLIKRFAFK